MGSSGTTVGACGTTAPESSTTASSAVAVRKGTKRINEESSKLQGKGGGKEGDVYMMIPPEPFRRRPPLNSTAFLRLKSTEKKRRQTPSSIVFEGDKNHLVPSDETSEILKAHD